MSERTTVGCNDCGAPYGADGWCDVVVPDEVWNTIAPEGGLLCFRCMTKRILGKGLEHVPVIVASGPYEDANERWRLIGFDHGYARGREVAKERRRYALLQAAATAYATGFFDDVSTCVGRAEALLAEIEHREARW
jgi:hypothetical protein